MVTQYFGEFAALGAAFLWSWTAIFFTFAGNRIGSMSVNVIRISIAMVLLFIVSLYSNGLEIALWFNGGSPWLLAASGVIGLAIGDSALFRAFVIFGARRTTLLMAIAPIITALIALPVLNEKLSIVAWIGIVITVGGVSWVVLERARENKDALTDNRKTIISGIILGLIAALCQSIGLILAKAGMNGNVSPVAATFLRMLVGGLIMWLFVFVSRSSSAISRTFRDHSSMKAIFAGSIVGPFLGVWLSLVAVAHTEAGIAATLMGTVPIMIIPWVMIIFKEHVTVRALFGTLLAILGTALLFSR